jgi:hypothetical protein
MGTKRRTLAPPGAALAACSLLLAACGGLPTDADEQMTEKQSALAAYPGATWDSNNRIVNVCFINSGFATEKTLVKNAVAAAWGVNSGLTFNWPANIGTDVCPQSPPGSGTIAPQYMPIWVHAPVDSGDWGGNCAPGYGSRQTDIATFCGNIATCQCMFSTASLTTNGNAFLAQTSVHEIGHGLGLPHEHQRADRPSNIATTCVDPNNATADWVNGGNYQKLTTLKLLTDYDGLGSLMSYCRDFDQNGVWDNPPFAQPSPLDALGIEIMYPKNFNRKPILGGFANASGSQFIVRSDKATAMKIDWIARGGHTTAVKNVRWSDNVTVFSTAVSPSLLITSTKIIKVQLDDTFNRHHAWTQTTAVPSNTRHTALLSNLAYVL